MDLDRALGDIAHIHRQIAKGEVYRGYRSLPVAASGLLGLLAAWMQPHALGADDPLAFVSYWIASAICAGLIGGSEIVYNYVVHDEAAARRQTRHVVGQFLPAVAAGGAITLCIARFGDAQIALLPGLWAICFGLGTFASRPYLPRASGWVALFYCAAGTGLLWTAHGGWPPGNWRVGGTFGAGQLLAALVLYWNLERPERGAEG